MDNSRGRSKGFTLLELLVVVVIVGILASIALPGYSRMVERSRVKEAEATLNMIFQAERVYRLDNTSYGRLVDLQTGNYLPPTGSGNWSFDADSDPAGIAAPFTTFRANANRLGGSFPGTIGLDENFSGAPQGTTVRNDYAGKTYLGTHALRD